jgi:O-antigen ligase
MPINAALIFTLAMVGIGVLITIYFWPSIALGMFLAIPLVKADMVMRFPFLTGTIGYIFDVGLVVIALLAIVIHLLKTRQGVRILIPRLFWLCWFVLSILVWVRLPASRDTVSGFQRAILFSVYNTLIMLLGSIYCSSFEAALKMTRAFLLVGIICTFGILLFGKTAAEYESARMTFAGAQSLAVADSIGRAIMVFLVFWLAKVKFLLRKLMIPFIALGLLAIFLAGGRGTILGLALSTMFIAYAYRKSHGIKTIVVGLILALVIGFVVNYFFTVATQAQQFGIESITKGILDRVYMVKSTLSEWSKSPVFGTGTGDMSFQLTGTVGEKTYPHNIYLEVLNELGIVGFVFYMGLIAYSIKIFKAAISYQLENIIPREFLVVIAAGLIYYILFGVKTGSYAGSGMLYFLLGAGLSLTEVAKRQLVEWEMYGYENADLQSLSREYNNIIE